MDKNYAVGLLIGLATGVGIGMLFAPTSGTHTRSLIANKASKGKEYLKERGDSLRHAATHLIEEGKQRIESQTGRITRAVEAGRHAYREATARSAASGI